MVLVNLSVRGICWFDRRLPRTTRYTKGAADSPTLAANAVVVSGRNGSGPMPEQRAMTHILPIRTGWMPSPGQSDDYPDDLPHDWRLPYFANEHLGVLVPVETWIAASSAELDAWREETPARFRFYLETTDRRTDGPRRVARALGNQFGGLVGDADAVAADWLTDAQRWVREQPGAPHSLLGGGSRGIALCCPTDLIRQPRDARRWIESLTDPASDTALAPSGPSILCLLGHCGFDDLRRWQGLVELMGLSF